MKRRKPPESVLTVSEIQQAIIPVARKYNVPAVYLFGSYARGDATHKSDVDLLVAQSGSMLDNNHSFFAFREDARKALRKHVDIVTLESLQGKYVNEKMPEFPIRLSRERVSLYEGT